TLCRSPVLRIGEMVGDGLLVGLDPLIDTSGGLREQVVAVGEVIGRRPGRDCCRPVDGPESQASGTLVGQDLDGSVDERRSPAVVPTHIDTTSSVVVIF